MTYTYERNIITNLQVILIKTCAGADKYQWRIPVWTSFYIWQVETIAGAIWTKAPLPGVIYDNQTKIALNSPNNKINYTEMINLLLWIIISHLFLKKRKGNEDTLNESSFEYQLKQDYSFSNLTSSFSIFLISSSACKRTKKNNLRNCNLTDAWSKIQQQQQQRRRWKKQKQTSSFALVIMYDTQRFASTMALTLRIWK